MKGLDGTYTYPFRN
ncbi:hypothetical protein ABFA07_022551 [Porites harrisoni]